jgi:hypothetical protein
MPLSTVRSAANGTSAVRTARWDEDQSHAVVRGSTASAGVVPGLLAVGLVERDGKVVLLSRSRLVRGDVDELWHTGQLGRFIPRRLAELESAQVRAPRRHGGVVPARLDPQDALEERRERRVAGRRAGGGPLSRRGGGGRGSLGRARCSSAR